MNLVTGKGSEAGDALVESDDVDMINFTGSTPVGREIAGKAGFKRLHLELGGKAYAIVLEDANLDLAARRCVYGSLKFSGQRCDAVSAILAVEGIADELVERMVAEAEGWKLGDPRDGSVSIGPLIDSRAAERISDLVKMRRRREPGSYWAAGIMMPILSRLYLIMSPRRLQRPGGDLRAFGSGHPLQG